MISRRAFGFRNFQNYRLRGLAQCGWNRVINRIEECPSTVNVVEPILDKLAEAVRFELTEDSHPRRFSRPVHSTALPSFRVESNCDCKAGIHTKP